MALPNLTSLKHKLAAVTAFTFVLLLVQAVLMSGKIDRIVDNGELIKDRTSVVIAKSFELKLHVVQVQQWLTDISATRGLDGLNDGFDQAAEHAKAAEALIGELQRLNPSQAPLYEAMRGDFAAYYAVGKRMAQAYVDAGPQGGNQVMAEFDGAAEKLQEEVAQAMASARELSAQSLDQSIALAEGVRFWTLAASGVLLLLVLVGGVFMHRSVIGPICSTAHLAAELADGDGDLTRRLDDQRRDEIGKVSRGINTFVDKIQATVVAMRSVATQLTDSSQHLTQAASQGQQKASNQLRETETVAAAMTELKASADEIAVTASETAQHTQTAVGQANGGNQAVQNAARVIKNLEGEIERAQAVINQLGEESSNIGAVLDVIRGISEQTNLLALNAAIEAARAGEQGRGFAVVADEVRTLASRTQQSTEEIQTMIGKLQARAGESIKVMAESRTMATASVTEVETARDLLQAIQSGFSGIQEMTHRIATAAEQQSQVSGDMDRNLVNIADLAKENAATADSISAASSQLGNLSGEIGSLISRFKTS
ncbi:MAG: methyl-accepting chemotaxis protein [Chromatiaceae bacterium]|nr:methyl-accepting chemotaxis protein [Chromatiaceae bacterium]MCP5313680.1 methyl-accepting chemotaxis protein [Chromatiaceae bacterium]